MAAPVVAATADQTLYAMSIKAFPPLIVEIMRAPEAVEDWIAQVEGLIHGSPEYMGHWKRALQNRVQVQWVADFLPVCDDWNMFRQTLRSLVTPAHATHTTHYRDVVTKHTPAAAPAAQLLAGNYYADQVNLQAVAEWPDFSQLTVSDGHNTRPEKMPIMKALNRGWN